MKYLLVEFVRLIYGVSMASKNRDTLFVCNECGNEFAKWQGTCSACGAWNSLKETESIIRVGRGKSKSVTSAKKIEVVLADKISNQSNLRVSSGISELDRVLGEDMSGGGKGIVPGSAILLAGEPGIGKSTLLSQLSFGLGEIGDVLYVSGEESVNQIGMRLQRLARGRESVGIKSISLVTTDSVSAIEELINKKAWKLVTIDSIQTVGCEDVDGAVGSVSQVRESSARLISVAKNNSIPIVLVGHVTKDGTIAGPRLLEHMVDVVLWFEGDRSQGLRLLRGVKNRFGTTNEIGVFMMESAGLVSVDNPSALFISERQESASGTVVTAVLEGTRVLLVEIQALVANSELPMPRRVASGFDYNRLQTLIAVLSKRMRLSLGTMDIFVNVVGGLKINDTAVDAAICSAIASAYYDKSLKKNLIVFGEVGLLGEVRMVRDYDLRIREAKRMGYNSIAAPRVRNIGDSGKNNGENSLRDIFEVAGLSK